MPKPKKMQLFQSLSGFQVRCNLISDRPVRCQMGCFNPYRVFKFAATWGMKHIDLLRSPVSIPIGFSSSLQHAFAFFVIFPGFRVSIPIGFSSSLQQEILKWPNGTPNIVSIPIGFSSSLQRYMRLDKSQGDIKFQSLSGFQVRCNLRIRIGISAASLVSIPIGFSSSLQQRTVPGGHSLSQPFQSLSGFQVRCNKISVCVLH